MSINLIFKNPIIKILLKNDITIYGKIVKNFIYSGLSFEELIKKDDQRIT